MNSVYCPGLSDDPHRLAVERVVATFADRLTQPPCLLEMARVARMSPFHFERVFRRITGLPPRKFLSAMRMRVALERVLATDARITDICFDMGYDSLGTFITQFKKLVGISPTRLRAVSRNPLEPVSGEIPAEVAYGDKQGHSVRVLGVVRHRGVVVSPVCIGLFSKASPEGMPLACAMTNGAGVYELIAPQAGRFHLFAAKLRIVKPACCLQTEVERIGQVTINTGVVQAERDILANIEMELPRPTDPPILAVFPLLAALRASHQQQYAAAGSGPGV